MLPTSKRSQTSKQAHAPLRVLAVTRIFPNRLEPLACAFQRQQLVALSRQCRVEVFATIPYLAGASLLGDRTRPGKLRRVPTRDALTQIEPLYRRLREEETRHVDRKHGMKAAAELLVTTLSERGTDYDRYILGLAANAT